MESKSFSVEACEGRGQATGTMSVLLWRDCHGGPRLESGVCGGIEKWGDTGLFSGKAWMGKAWILDRLSSSLYTILVPGSPGSSGNSI